MLLLLSVMWGMYYLLPRGQASALSLLLSGVAASLSAGLTAFCS